MCRRAVLFALPLLILACTEPNPVPSKLTFTVVPANATAGAALSVTVEIQDARGSRVPGASNSVTLALANNPGNGTLSGTASIPAVNGTAAFTNLHLDKVGVGYTLTASSSGLSSATSSGFNIAAGSPVWLNYLTVPTQVQAGIPITPAIQVAVKDLLGNLVTTATSAVSLSLSSGPGVLSGTKTVTAVAGIATFADLTLDKVGTDYAIRATSVGLAQALTAPFTVSSGPPAKLGFTVQPASAFPDTPVDPPVTVAVQDAGGNLVVSASNLITLQLGANPGGATLSGTTGVTAVGGVAQFPNLRLNTAATGYTLLAASPGLTSATSAAFAVRNPLTFTTVSAGYFHSCGLLPGGAAWCWGENFGKLGDGTEISSPVPVPVAGGLTFTSISAGRNHNCALTAAGAAYCWGLNGDGELGDGTGIDRLAPTLVSGGLAFASVIAGYSHSCGVTLAGVAYCWGSNSAGAVGDGSVTRRLAPTPVGGGLTFRSVVPGRDFTCGVTTADAAWCWGTNTDGELGNGTSGNSSTFPVAVSGGLSFAEARAGGFHSCGRTTAGAVYCWGANFSGQLGSNSGTASKVPVVVPGLTVTSLSVGNRHNCGLTAGGSAICWGDNSDGNLGAGDFDSHSAPVGVTGALSFTSISAGRFHSCGVAAGNIGYCWGSNFSGTLGSGAAALYPQPVRIR